MLVLVLVLAAPPTSEAATAESMDGCECNEDAVFEDTDEDMEWERVPRPLPCVDDC